MTLPVATCESVPHDPSRRAGLSGPADGKAVRIAGVTLCATAVTVALVCVLAWYPGPGVRAAPSGYLLSFVVLSLLCAVAGLALALLGERARNARHRAVAEAAEYSRAQMEQAASLAKLGYYVYDVDAEEIVYCTEQHARSHGCGREEYLRKCSTMSNGMPLIHPDDRAAVRDAYARVLRGETSEVEYRAVTPGGERRILEITQPVFDATGRVFRELATTLDITEMHRREVALSDALHRAMEADAAKDRFLASMSHDLRTPLNAIIGFSDALRMEFAGPLNERQSEYVNYIHDSSRRLLDMVADILALSDFCAPNRRHDLRPTDLLPSLHRIVVETRQVAEARTVAILPDLPPDLPAILADPARCERVFSNILGNAVDHTPAGGRVHLRAVEDRGCVVVTVEDTGPGFPEGTADLRKPFVQGKAAGSGVGLGLAIADSIMKLHKGSLHLANGVEGGARVELRFPVSRVRADDEAVEPARLRKVG